VISADDAVALAAPAGAEMAKAARTSRPACLPFSAATRPSARAARTTRPGRGQPQRRGQIVAAGRLSALDKLAEDPARERPGFAHWVSPALPHRFMASALDSLRRRGAEGGDSEPTAVLFVTATASRELGADAMEKLVAQ